jgi:4-alpha-glucanotransferase
MTEPIGFVFGLHLHQPVGNFDHVFQQHIDEVYGPFLDHFEPRSALRAAFHISGPLLEWIDAHAPELVERIRRLAEAGRVELLLSGFYEPVLAVLPRADRVVQIRWMREAIEAHFGVVATGLWLTERVWEPGLPSDLAEAGVEYSFVDDRHFLVTGVRREALHRPFRTEDGGRTIDLLPIDERLRYLVPFRAVSETADHLRTLREQGQPLAVLADDAEKFGGWPGTAQWVYENGWLDRFFDELERLQETGEVRMILPREAIAEVPSGGLVYLPSASYREMEGWSLPPFAAQELTELEASLGEDLLDNQVGALVRGGHWRNFLARYPESNRMHKMAAALSELCRERGDPEPPRRAVGRAQCNDAYWHGVFGGLYLPHLREAVWRNLAEAERLLRKGEPLGFEWVDLDCDGRSELWIHSSGFSALIAPHRGACVETWTHFASGVNHVDVLTRRPEAYHEVTRGDPEADHVGGDDADGAPSIHDLEHAFRIDECPAYDAHDRACFVEFVLAPPVTREDWIAGLAAPQATWARTAMDLEDVRVTETGVVAAFSSSSPRLRKTLAVDEAGDWTVRYVWNPDEHEAGARLAIELSYREAVVIEPEGESPEVWTYPITTVSKSESGAETIVQGQCWTGLWPVSAGGCRLRVRDGS